ncbi:unnamed protein product, partial [Choristocarpus tenellus]
DNLLGGERRGATVFFGVGFGLVLLVSILFDLPWCGDLISYDDSLLSSDKVDWGGGARKVLAKAFQRRVRRTFFPAVRCALCVGGCIVCAKWVKASEGGREV